MKLLHLADLHIGKSVNGFSMLEDQRYILKDILSMADTHQIDAFIIAGDIYDKSAPSAEAVTLLDWFFDEIALRNKACIITAGNHDSAQRIAYASSFLKKHRFYVSPVFEGSIDHITLQDEYGPVTFWLMPFLKPAMVRPYFPDEDIQADYNKACEAVIATCPLNREQRNILVAHQFVTSSGTTTQRSDSELSLGGMDNVDASIFADFDYVALGHIHRPQQVGKPSCRYAGSPLKYSFSEIPYPKTVPLITLREKGTIDIELLPLHPLHDMQKIKGTIETLLSPEFSSTLQTDNYIYAVLTDEVLPPNAVSRLRCVYPLIMGMDHIPKRDKPTTLENAPVDFDDSKSAFDLFSDFYVMQNKTELTEEQQNYIRSVLEDIEVS